MKVHEVPPGRYFRTLIINRLGSTCYQRSSSGTTCGPRVECWRGNEKIFLWGENECVIEKSGFHECVESAGFDI